MNDALKTLLSGRSVLVGYLPTTAAAVFLLILAGAGTPPDFGRAWRTASGLGTAQLVLIGLGILLVTVLAAPLQLHLVRLLEGAWPRWLGSGLARRRQLRRHGRPLPPLTAGSTEAEIQRAGIAAVRARRRFPAPVHLVRPTALGNVLAALEDSAGRAYGLDAVVAWPRLYPLLPPPTKAIVDDRRDTLDAAARLTVTGAFTALASAVLLAGGGWWLLLAALPLLVSCAAYRGAVEAALAYAEAVHTSFDLHRFDLLKAVHLPLPADPAAEARLGAELSALWRQNVPLTSSYRHPDA